MKSKAIVRQKKGIRKIWSWVPKGCPTPRRTGRLTIGHNINSTHLNSRLKEVSKFRQQNMVMSPVELRPEKDSTGEAEQQLKATDPTSG
jgi:hypothetical protein